MKKKIDYTNKKNLDCRDYTQKIVPFLQDELDPVAVHKLLKHVKQCSECREELKIQYMVREGLNRLEKGKNFDFRKDFETKMQKAEKNNTLICRAQKAAYFAEAAGLIGVVAVLLISLF